MSDEPLYCPACGVEIGPDHKDCDYDYNSPVLPRAERYCDVCGVIPAGGKECQFYCGVQGNTRGCTT